jgi:hypothetical protein
MAATAICAAIAVIALSVSVLRTHRVLRRYAQESVAFDRAMQALAKTAQTRFLANQLLSATLAAGLAAGLAAALPGQNLLALLLTAPLAIVIIALSGLVARPLALDAGVAWIAPIEALADRRTADHGFAQVWRFADRIARIRVWIALQSRDKARAGRDVTNALDGARRIRPPLVPSGDPITAELKLRFKSLSMLWRPAAIMSVLAWVTAALTPTGSVPALPTPGDLWQLAASNDDPDPAQDLNPAASDDDPQGGPSEPEGGTEADSAEDGDKDANPNTVRGSDGEFSSDGNGGGGANAGAGTEGNGDISQHGNRGPSTEPDADSAPTPQSGGAGQESGEPPSPEFEGAETGEAAGPDADQAQQGGGGSDTAAAADSGAGEGQMDTTESESAASGPSGPASGASDTRPGTADEAGDQADASGNGGADGQGSTPGEEASDGISTTTDGPSGGGSASADTADGPSNLESGETVEPDATGQGPEEMATYGPVNAEGDRISSDASDGRAGTPDTTPIDGRPAGDRTEVGAAEAVSARPDSAGGQPEDDGLQTSETILAPGQATPEAEPTETRATGSTTGRPEPDALEGAVLAPDRTEQDGDAIVIATPPTLFAEPGQAPPVLRTDISPDEATTMPSGPVDPPQQSMPAWIADLLR